MVQPYEELKRMTRWAESTLVLSEGQEAGVVDKYCIQITLITSV